MSGAENQPAVQEAAGDYRMSQSGGFSLVRAEGGVYLAQDDDYNFEAMKGNYELLSEEDAARKIAEHIADKLIEEDQMTTEEEDAFDKGGKNGLIAYYSAGTLEAIKGMRMASEEEAKRETEA